MKPAGKYVALLERELEFMRTQLAQSRSDVEFYRGKVERLELALMSEANVPAQHNYAARSETRPTVLTRPGGWTPAPPRIPFSELKHRWNAMSEKEQNEAIEKGWNVEQEEPHAGS